MDKQQLARELAMEYVRKTKELSPSTVPEYYVEVYLNAFHRILSELEKSEQPPDRQEE